MDGAFDFNGYGSSSRCHIHLYSPNVLMGGPQIFAVLAGQPVNEPSWADVVKAFNEMAYKVRDIAVRSNSSVTIGLTCGLGLAVCVS